MTMALLVLHYLLL